MSICLRGFISIIIQVLLRKKSNLFGGDIVLFLFLVANIGMPKSSGSRRRHIATYV